ncbi:MAG: peptide deformylase, partial [Emcibacter sp.]|nr:peptide deformylase [Emcibacter sp.]
MAILPIITVPDPILKTVSAPVAAVGDDLLALMDDMLETMSDAPGIGLAAPQVGVLSRLIVLDCIKEEGAAPRPLAMFNPEVLSFSEETATYEEGCLSFPEEYADVKRHAECHVAYLDENGEEQLLKAEGLLSTCVQHEIDHLDGIVFVDYPSTVKRSMILRRLK